MEIEMTYTTGPWRWVRVDYGPNFDDGNYVIEDGGPFDALWADEKNRPVFVAQDGSAYRASCDFPDDGDAVLIAAAPDLLDALEDLMATYDDARDPIAAHNARAAIAKAKGEQA